jgi:hypothetical protein
MLTAKTRASLMVFGSTITLLSALFLPWTIFTIVRSIGECIITPGHPPDCPPLFLRGAPPETTDGSLGQLVLATGFNGSEWQVFLAAILLLLTGLITAFLHGPAVRFLSRLIGYGIHLGVVGAFIFATIRTFHQYQIDLAGLSGSSLLPGLGFYGVILGLAVATIGAYLPEKVKKTDRTDVHPGHLDGKKVRNERSKAEG